MHANSPLFIISHFQIYMFTVYILIASFARTVCLFIFSENNLVNKSIFCRCFSHFYRLSNRFLHPFEKLFIIVYIACGTLSLYADHSDRPIHHVIAIWQFSKLIDWIKNACAMLLNLSRYLHSDMAVLVRLSL